MAFYIVQFLTGLASAASLFLVASGLSIIFGVTRIVNFAHGAFYMLGAYVAFTLTERFSGAFGFWGGIVIAAFYRIEELRNCRSCRLDCGSGGRHRTTRTARQNECSKHKRQKRVNGMSGT